MVYQIDFVDLHKPVVEDRDVSISYLLDQRIDLKPLDVEEI